VNRHEKRGFGRGVNLQRKAGVNMGGNSNSIIVALKQYKIVSTMRHLLVYILIVTICSSLLCQNQNNVWYFGHYAGLDFKTATPSAIASQMDAQEGCASISDPAGNLLFYSDGITVWDRNHQIMPNGTGLSGGSSSTQATLIVPFPNSGSMYYIFTTEDYFTDGGMNYSVVDMNLNYGFGDIILNSKNTLVVNQVAEKLTSVLHENGKDIWIITHRLNSNEFLSYLLTSSGLNLTPIVSAIGSVYPGPFDGAIGYLKPSHKGTKMISPVTDHQILEMFDFNKSTGELTNLVDLKPFFDETLFVYGLEFSPNDSLLYLGSSLFENSLYQLDLTTHIATLLSTNSKYYGAFQLGPDNKIYIANNGSSFLGSILEPNKIGVECNYHEEELELNTGTTSALGLPNPAPYSFLHPDLFTLGEDTMLCVGEQLTLSIFPTLPCDSIKYFWNDGSTTSSISVSQTGIYWVEIKSPCINKRDTIQVDYLNCLPIVWYNLDSCRAYMIDGSNMDYSEFTPAYPNIIPCADFTGSNVFRASEPENKHSCTPGVSGSVAMCITSSNSCTYSAGNPFSLVSEIIINPAPDSTVWLTGLEYYEKAPVNYSWINGGTGLNNYPTRYGVRILKNETEVFRIEDIKTDINWVKQFNNFTSNSAFRVDSYTIFRIEWLPYCPIGNGSTVSAWDIDEIKFFAACVSTLSSKTSIVGEVLTKDGIAIPNVEMQLSPVLSFTNFDKRLTDEFGTYSFNQLEKGDSYYLRGYKNDDTRNGVSTLDLIQIQRQLLGITPFTSLGQYIAADVNHSGTVTVLDLVDLRKVILGISNGFPQNTSWRFGLLPQELNNTNINNFLEIRNLEYIENDTLLADFIGIKVGDVNGDVDLSGFKSNIIFRSENELEILCEAWNNPLSSDSHIQIRSTFESDIIGLQFALNLENDYIISFDESVINITPENYSYNNGILRISWNSKEPVHITPDEVLFNFNIKSRDYIKRPFSISLQREALKPEIYLSNLEIKNLKFGENAAYDLINPRILQIAPTLAQTSINVNFYSEKSGTVVIYFYDSSGNCIHTIKKYYNQGFHIEIIDLDKFPKNDLIFCMLLMEGNSTFEKFVIVKE